MVETGPSASTGQPSGPFLVDRAMFAAYRTLGRAVTPFMSRWIGGRVERGKEDRARIEERFGHASRERPAGPLVWIHAASVGEMNAAWPLMSLIGEAGFNVLLTTGTVTSAAIAASRKADAVIHQFAPLDLPVAIRRFLDHWRPDLAILVESELWPGIIAALAQREAPVLVVNGRLSARSLAGWRRLRPLASAFGRRIDLCLASSEEDAARFRRLGLTRVETTGNLKFDVPAPDASSGELAPLRTILGERTMVLAASTHEGEEDALLEAFPERDDAILVLAPRHPERGDQVEAMIDKHGYAWTRRSKGQSMTAGVFLADTVGEMGLWYALADVCFVGGSLVPHGGQNPIEPAKAGVPILHGPHVGNFAAVYGALDRSGGARPVTSTAALSRALAELVGDQAARRTMSERARETIRDGEGALARTMQAIGPFLETSRRRHGP